MSRRMRTVNGNWCEGSEVGQWGGQWGTSHRAETASSRCMRALNKIHTLHPSPQIMIFNLCVFVSFSFHVYAFLLESIWWKSKRTHKVFGVSEDDAAAVSGFAYNQGFYTLFLALTSAYGYYLMLSEKTFHFGAGMLCASSIVQAGAGFILFSSGGKKYVIVACMQGLAPLLIIYRIFNWY